MRTTRTMAMALAVAGGMAWTATAGETATGSKTVSPRSSTVITNQIVITDYRQHTYENCIFKNCKGERGGAILLLRGSLVLKNCTFQNNEATGDRFMGGGAVFINEDCSATIEHCDFIGNKVSNGHGGAMMVYGNNVVVSNCQFTGNYENSSSDTGYGGAIYWSGRNGKISCCVMSSNSAKTHGGALFVSSQASGLRIDRCVFQQNTARQNDGGAISWGGTGGVINRSRFVGNRAAEEGGSMEAYTSPGMDTITVAVTGCLFETNTSGKAGGAIFSGKTTFTVRDSVFRKNTAGTTGGAIYNEQTATLAGNTFSGNSAKWGGAVYNQGSGATLSNNALVGNSATKTVDSSGQSRGGWGAGVYVNQGTVRSTGDVYQKNSTPLGGAGASLVENATYIASGCSFLFNQAPYYTDVYSRGTLTMSGTKYASSYTSQSGVLLTKSGDKLVSCTPDKKGAYTVPSKVAGIEAHAFFGCGALTSTTVGNNVKTIGAHAFSSCGALATVTLGTGLTDIGAYAFSGDTALKTAKLPSGLTTIREGLFSGCGKLTSAGIPNGVKSIGDYAFSGCGKLPSVTFPSSVTDIGDLAFAGCGGLETVVIPGNVTHVGWRAFADCTGLKTAILMGTATTVDGGVFSGCSGLETLMVPASWRGTEKMVRLSRDLPAGCAVKHLVEQTVTFNAMEGTCPTATKKYISEMPYGDLPTAERQGHVFLGWFPMAEGGEQVTEDSVVTTAATRTLFAHWKAVEPASVWRFYSAKYKGHFFTISETEKKRLIDTNPNWKFEGPAYRAYTKKTGGTVALYRFWSAKYKGHFYTISESEMRTVRDTNPNWKYDGIAYWVYPSKVEGSLPVYRFWSAKYKHHFYTISESEMRRVRDTNPNWKYERIAFWALPMPKAKAKGVRRVGGEAEETVQAETTDEKGSPSSQTRAIGRRSAKGTMGGCGVAVTTSDGSDGSAVADGDAGTGWSPAEAGPGWVALSFEEPVEVGSVEVEGENLPEGLRALWSEDAETWEEEGAMEAARYVWVAWDAAEREPLVREVRVCPPQAATDE